MRMNVFAKLKQEIADGTIVAISTRLGQRVTKEEMIAAAMQLWEQDVIEEALGEEAAAVLPEAIRLDRMPARELEGVASAHCDELVGRVKGFEVAMAWG